MKIVCKKENDVNKMLEYVKHFLESETLDYPLLQEDLILEFSLKDENGFSSPQNNQVICFEEQDLQNTADNVSTLEYYYNNDALTKLYNRAKYERDILKLLTITPDAFTCVYMDAIGLHEVNNHLGHAAGDFMLCSIADGIRQFFSHSSAYRIGGDEFVIFCLHQKEADIRQAISDLKNYLLQEEYEISVGMYTNSNCLSPIETINRAESDMRYDKAQFYQTSGAKRQMRNLNYKLEKILLEKQDASHFLNVIAFEYKGVYVVNPDKDTCRYIYIPDYFKDILEHNNGTFSKSILTYCDMLVCEQDQPQFSQVSDFDYVLSQLQQNNQIEFSYEKKDGNRVRLQIIPYTPDFSDTNEMLWIFLDEKHV